MGKRGPKSMPTTPAEWQLAVDLADAALHLDAARAYARRRSCVTAGDERLHFFTTLNKELLDRADELEQRYGVKPVDMMAPWVKEQLDAGNVMLPESIDPPAGGAS